MDNITAINKTVEYTVKISHAYGGEITVSVSGIEDNDRNNGIVADTLHKAAMQFHPQGKHPADRMHDILLRIIDELMEKKGKYPKNFCFTAREVKDIAGAIELYEGFRFPINGTKNAKEIIERLSNALDAAKAYIPHKSGSLGYEIDRALLNARTFIMAEE